MEAFHSVTRYIVGYYRDDGKQNGSNYSMTGIMEKKMEATIIPWSKF